MSDKKCPYCGRKVVSGANCSKCSTTYHASCALRCTTSRKGILKCCEPAKQPAQLSDDTPASSDQVNAAIQNNSSSNCSMNSAAGANSSLLDTSTSSSGATCQPNLPAPIGSPVDLNTVLNEVRYSSAVIKREIQRSNENLSQDLHNHIEITKASISNIQNQLSNFDQRINTNKLASNSTLSSIAEVKGQIQDIFTKLATLTSNSSNVPDSGVGPQVQLNGKPYITNLAQEIQDRLARSNNLIIYGLPEAQDQQVNDAHTIKEILGKIGNLDINNLNIKRIGASSKNKNRPILVRLRSQGEVLRVIRNRNLLPRNLFFSTDKTPSQRNQLKKLKEAANAHNSSNPAVRKIIKYVNGEPTIVDAAPNPPNNPDDDQHPKN